MSTTLQLKLQRSRFAHHAAASLAALVPAPLRFLKWASTPPAATLSPAERATREASEVRDMARTYGKTQPGFAAVLAAAADRHERLYGE